MEIDRKKYAYNYLIKQGYTPVIASGVVSNLVAESNLNTNVLGKADDKGSNGIAQWHSERLNGLKNYANQKGKKWTDLDVQLDYISYELKTSHKTAWNKLKYSKTPEEASDAFMQHYEKPANWAIDQSKLTRAKQARDLFGGDLDPDYVSKYQGTIVDEEDSSSTQPTKNYLPDLITMQGKESNEVVDLSFAEKAEEAKEQIQQYQEVEDKINQMPTTQAPIQQQQVEQQTPSYQYLFNQELFNIQ